MGTGLTYYTLCSYWPSSFELLASPPVSLGCKAIMWETGRVHLNTPHCPPFCVYNIIVISRYIAAVFFSTAFVSLSALRGSFHRSMVRDIMAC